MLLHVYHSTLQSRYSASEVISRFSVSPPPDNAHPYEPFDPIASGQLATGPACFGILLAKEEYARWLSSLCGLFVDATSLGAVESLMEWRWKSDHVSDKRIGELYSLCLVLEEVG